MLLINIIIKYNTIIYNLYSITKQYFSKIDVDNIENFTKKKSKIKVFTFIMLNFFSYFHKNAKIKFKKL